MCNEDFFFSLDVSFVIISICPNCFTALFFLTRLLAFKLSLVLKNVNVPSQFYFEIKLNTHIFLSFLALG